MYECTQDLTATKQSARVLFTAKKQFVDFFFVTNTCLNCAIISLSWIFCLVLSPFHILNWIRLKLDRKTKCNSLNCSIFNHSKQWFVLTSFHRFLNEKFVFLTMTSALRVSCAHIILDCMNDAQNFP